ncbi:hypothetical protein [Marinifilum sp. D714]|uniref:hypothetical protein n=1 Tax=Marinifilum sp. D714 TaxID=2937523 RepID=UPI0027CA8D0C|nr:hypothetical protein [Marinifilum sp. D714]MDQ2179490.1 hypothetical protein [Marinifilum sp. D714]
MKRLILLTMFCIGFVGISLNSYAQSTAVKPYNGAKHKYKFQNVQVGAQYEFYVSSSFVNNGADSKVSTYGTMKNGDGSALPTFPVSVPAGGEVSVQIEWAADANTTHSAGVYLFLHVTGANVNGCSPENFKAVFIQPQANDFNLAIADAAVKDPDCADLTNLQPVINKGDILVNDDYDPGYTILSFDVTRTKSSNAWSATYKVSCNDSDVKFAIGTTDTPATGEKNGSISGETANTHTIQIKVPNVPGKNPTFTVTLLTGTDDKTGVTDLDLSGEVADHTINVMPTIGNFVGE